MKVRVVLSVDVDVDAWRAEYGDPTITADDIRRAVRDGTVTAVREPGVIVPAGILLDVEELSDR
jgi:hypothetical protein